MNCEACQTALIDFEHGELDPPERTEVARHLAHCSQCALESCRLRADLEGIADAYAEAPPREVRAALRSRVESAIRPPWWTRVGRAVRRPIPAYGAVMAALAPLAIWGAMTLAGDRQASTPHAPPSAPAIAEYDGAANHINAPGVL